MSGKFKVIPISFVVDADLQNVSQRKTGRNEIDIDCPFCNGHYKMNINLKKNMFRCNKCDEHGNALSLHAKLNGLSNKQAYKQLAAMMENGNIQPVSVESEPEPEEETLITSLRNLVNTSLLDALMNTVPFDDKHLNDLKRRGLTDEYIKERRYWSFGGLSKEMESDLQLEFDSILWSSEDRKLMFNRHAGKLPGFYGDGSNDDLLYQIVSRKNGGYLIPVRTLYDEISGFQIRHFKRPNETDKDFRKYTWLSSRERENGIGVTGIQQIHHVGFKKGDHIEVPETVYLTEGALKADVASFLSGKAFIALIGVNNTSQLRSSLDALKECGCKKIRVCVDMDYLTNKHVDKAMHKIIKDIQEAGLQVEMVKWNPEYKGIDDYLLAKQNGKIGKC